MSEHAVLLRHTPPGAVAHYDLMLLRPEGRPDDPDRRDLLTFRLATPLDWLAPGEALHAERIGDHRNRYLDFEGDIGRGRGVVERVDAGPLRWMRLGETEFEALVEWRVATQRLRGVAGERGRWLIERLV